MTRSEAECYQTTNLDGLKFKNWEKFRKVSSIQIQFWVFFIGIFLMRNNMAIPI